MDLSTKFIQICANLYEFFARKIGYNMNGLYCILCIPVALDLINFFIAFSI